MYIYLNLFTYKQTSWSANQVMRGARSTVNHKLSDNFGQFMITI